jgi:hypothetical protein
MKRRSWREAMADVGQNGKASSSNLSADYRFGKQTIAGIGSNEEDAPGAAVL